MFASRMLGRANELTCSLPVRPSRPVPARPVATVRQCRSATTIPMPFGNPTIDQSASELQRQIAAEREGGPFLVHREPDIFRPGIPTALAALFGCLVFLTLNRALDLPEGPAAWIAIAAVFLMRYLALRHNVRTRSIIGFGSDD